MQRKFGIGDVVKHFKRETIKDNERSNVYLYRIEGYAEHTETKEKLVVYSAIYNGEKYGLDVKYGNVYARPYDMFMSEVDHEKYPNIEQKYRFESYKSFIS